MPKNRKTRKQKMQASRRQQVVHPTIRDTSPQVTQTTVKVHEKFSFRTTSTHNNVTLLNPHTYLKGELSKTALLSGGIIIFELLLFFLLRNHLIVLPNLPY